MYLPVSIQSGLKAALLASVVVCTQGAFAAGNTLDKIKASGAVTMGVRESSIPMSYTTGDSRFDGFHVEVCRMILNDIKDKLGLSTLRINYQPLLRRIAYLWFKMERLILSAAQQPITPPGIAM